MEPAKPDYKAKFAAEEADELSLELEGEIAPEQPDSAMPDQPSSGEIPPLTIPRRDGKKVTTVADSSLRHFRLLFASAGLVQCPRVYTRPEIVKGINIYWTQKTRRGLSSSWLMVWGNVLQTMKTQPNRVKTYFPPVKQPRADDLAWGAVEAPPGALTQQRANALLTRYPSSARIAQAQGDPLPISQPSTTWLLLAQCSTEDCDKTN